MPPAFAGGDSVKVQSILEGGGNVSFTKGDIFSEGVRIQLEEGKLVTSLGMGWTDSITFRLSEDMALSGIAFSDILTMQNDDISREDVYARFDADFLLFRSEFSALFAALVDALGGEAKA